MQVHYEGIHRIDPVTGERADVVDEIQEAVVQCLDCMHDQPHLGFHNGRIEPIEDRWERMVAGTPWVASCTVTVDADAVETCSGPEAADALAYAAFGDHGTREFFTHVRFHKHDEDQIVVHLLVELYARSNEEATLVLEEAARGALAITSLAEESRPARRHRRRASALDAVEALLEQVELARQPARQLVAELGVELADRLDLRLPLLGVDLQAARRGPRRRCRAPRGRARPWPDSRPIGVSSAAASPSQRRKTQASTREFSPKPGHRKRPSSGSLRNQLTKNMRGRTAPSRSPISCQWPEVVAHVVAAERQHRERVAAQLADVAGGRGGRLGAHDRAEEDAVLPVERLGHERHDARAAPAEQEGVDRHARRVLPLGRDRRVLRGRRREARVRMRGRRRRTPASSRCPSSRSHGRAAPWSCPPTRCRRRRSARSS